MHGRLFAKMATVAAVVTIALSPPRARPDGRATEAPYQQAAGATPGGDSYGAGAQKGPNGQPQQPKAQKSSWFRSWFAMAKRTQASEPDWLSPLATTSGRLKNELRYDVWQQPASGGNTNFQLGGSKGLEFITSSRT